MLTVFSSNFSQRLGASSLVDRVLVGSDATLYYGYFCHHDALINADVHVTSAALNTSTITCRDLVVRRIKCSGFYNCSLRYTRRIIYPYSGSVLLYVMKYSEGQKTDYSNSIVDLKTLPLYTDPGDVVFHKHYFNKARLFSGCDVNFSFDIRTNITIKPNQRLRFCLFCFAGDKEDIQVLNVSLTTTVFYNGN